MSAVELDPEQSFLSASNIRVLVVPVDCPQDKFLLYQQVIKENASQVRFEEITWEALTPNASSQYLQHRPRQTGRFLSKLQDTFNSSTLTGRRATKVSDRTGKSFRPFERSLE